jgi:hypothetical protein
VVSFGSARGNAEAVVYHRAQDVKRIAQRITPGAELIAALLFSLGIWAAIGLGVSSFASAWLK